MGFKMCNLLQPKFLRVDNKGLGFKMWLHRLQWYFSVLVSSSSMDCGGPKDELLRSLAMGAWMSDGSYSCPSVRAVTYVPWPCFLWTAPGQWLRMMELLSIAGLPNQEMLDQGLSISLSEAFWEVAWHLRLFPLTPLSQGSDIPVFLSLFSVVDIAPNQAFAHLILMWCLLRGGHELTQDPLACFSLASVPLTPSCFREVPCMCSWTRATPHPFLLQPRLPRAMSLLKTLMFLKPHEDPPLLLPPLRLFVGLLTPTSCTIHQTPVLIWGRAYCR